MKYEYETRTCDRNYTAIHVEKMAVLGWEPHLMAGDGNFGGIVIIFRREKEKPSKGK